MKISWLRDQVIAGAIQITIDHVRSHSGHLLNEAADALARMARRARQHGHSLFHADSRVPLGGAAKEVVAPMALSYRRPSPGS